MTSTGLGLPVSERLPVNRDSPLLIVVHVHYPDVWEQMAERIAATLPVEFYLVVTTSLQLATDLPRPRSRFLAGFEVMRAPNIGRDMRPFLMALGRYGDFDVGLKLHTKRSLHRLEGDRWREAMIASLLPDQERVLRLVGLMRSDHRLSLIAPDDMLVSAAPWLGRNRPKMVEIAERIGLDLAAAERRTPVLCAGSMFWFRPASMAPLQLSAIDDLFAPEMGQRDGTAAHALERMMTLMAEAQEGVVTSMTGALERWSSEAPLEELRRGARTEVDRPNDNLPVLTPLARRFAEMPALMKFYEALSPAWRQRIRRLARRR